MRTGIPFGAYLGVYLYTYKRCTREQALERLRLIKTGDVDEEEM